MADRTERLKRLVRLQNQIKALHETKHAQHLAQAAAASQEASELIEAMNAASPIPGLFPDLYNRKIGAAIDREERSRTDARQEAGHVAKATIRTNMVTRAYQESMRFDERQHAEKEQLENVSRRLPDKRRQ